MVHRFAKTASFWIVGLLVCASARAQFIPLSRCQSAIPCSIPFAVTYRPDPLIAGQYGNSASHTPLVVTMPLKTPLLPRLETAHPPFLESALEDAIHRSLHPQPASGSGQPKRGTAEEPKPATGNEPKSEPPH
jgi:hypothetical protein